MSESYYNRVGMPKEKPNKVKAQRRTSAYGIFFHENSVLLVQNNWGRLYELPGGGENKNESSLACLKRELLEETGIIVEKIREIPVKTIKSNFYADDLRIFFNSTMHFYLIEKATIPEKLKGDSEIQKVLFLPLSDVTSKKVKPEHAHIIISCKKEFLKK